MTLERVFKEWLEFDINGVRKGNTYDCYRYATKRIEKYSPDIWHTEIEKIKQRELQMCLTVLQKHYAKSSIKHTRVAINLAFNYAIVNGYITDNGKPSRLQVPKNANVKKIDALSKSEQLEIEEIAKKVHAF